MKLVMACLYLSLPFSDAADWPCWRGPEHDGISMEANLNLDFPGGNPTELWRIRVGEGFSGLVTSGDRLVTMVVEGGREKVLCVSVVDGKRLWESDSDAEFREGAGNGPRGTPTIVGNRVYSHGAMGIVQCLDLASGRPVWRVDLKDAVGAKVPQWGLASSPLVQGTRLFLISGGPGACAVAMDTRTGRVLWRSVDGDPSYSTPSIGEVGGWKNLVVLTREAAFGLAPETGRVQWQFPVTDDHNIPTPVWGEAGQLFLAGNRSGRLLKISGGLGRLSVEEVYGERSFANSQGTSVFHGGYLYGFYKDGLGCLQLSSGRMLWLEDSPDKGTLLVADGHLFALSEEGELYVAPASPNGFEPVAQARVLSRGVCWTVPTLANGRLFVRNKYELACFDLRRGGTADSDIAPDVDPGADGAVEQENVAPTESPSGMSSASRVDAPNEPPRADGQLSAVTSPATTSSKSTTNSHERGPRKMTRQFLLLSLCVIGGMIGAIIYLWWKLVGMHHFGGTR